MFQTIRRQYVSSSGEEEFGEDIQLQAKRNSFVVGASAEVETVERTLSMIFQLKKEQS